MAIRISNLQWAHTGIRRPKASISVFEQLATLGAQLDSRLQALEVLEAPCKSRRLACETTEASNQSQEELAKAVRAILDTIKTLVVEVQADSWRAAIEPLLTKIRKVRCPAVVKVMRDFIAELLHQIFTHTPTEEDVQSWSRPSRLADVLLSLSGVTGIDDGWKVANETPADLVPCDLCVCRHIAIQEVLTLIRHVQKFSVEHGASALPLHFENGLCMAMLILRKLLHNVHELCYIPENVSVNDAMAKSLSWRSLLLEVISTTSDCRYVAQCPLFVSIHEHGDRLQKAADAKAAQLRAKPSPVPDFAASLPFKNWPPVLVAPKD